MKNFVLLAALILSLPAFTQTNFTYMPEKPKPGDEIKFYYSPSGDLTGLMKVPDAYVMQFTEKGQKIIDFSLQREDGKFVGKIKTDTAATMLAFGFSADEKIDNNFNNGYLVHLYDAGVIKKGSYVAAAKFYEYFGGWSFGVKSDKAKAIGFYTKEFATFADSRNKYLMDYLSALSRENRDKGLAEIQAELEKRLVRRLETPDQYDTIISLYNSARLRNQANVFKNLKKEKFPDAPLSIEDYWEEFNSAGPDLKEKEDVIAKAIKAVDKNENPESYKRAVDYFYSFLLNSYGSAKDWDAYKRIAGKISDKSSLASAYNDRAWKMQEDSSNLAYAEKISAFATNYAKNEIAKPTGAKPRMSTSKEWEKQRKDNYAMYADTYAMIMYRMGNYKKGLPYAKDAAQLVNEFKNSDYNKTYALLAERALPPKTYKPQLEQMVKEGKANAGVKDALKRLFIKQKGSESGFDNYIAALEKEAYLKMVANLRKEMISETTPQFALKDLSGNNVNMADLKGKTVIVDFWATWCGPCIASMPGMKKMVNKYKDDPNVKFLFIDTWQNEENETDVVKKFIADKGYSDFHVLMDLDDKVGSQFKVDGIPTKFIIGRDGNVKFKEVGFDGEENLIKKIPAMIELSN